MVSAIAGMPFNELISKEPHKAIANKRFLFDSCHSPFYVTFYCYFYCPMYDFCMIFILSKRPTEILNFDTTT